MSQRKHPRIINVSEVEARTETKGAKFGYSGRRLGPRVGAKSIGCSYFEVEPGRQAFPNHFHTANEESVFVIEGQGHVRIGPDEIEIRVGDYISFPVGPDNSHSVRNSSKTVLRLLCFSTLNPVEVVGYPDSQKTAAFAMPDASQGLRSGGSPWVRMLVKNQPPVDYYEGEL